MEGLTQSNPLVNGTACLLVHFRRPGIKRKIRDDQYVTGDIEVGSDGKLTAEGAAEKSLTGANKIILDSPEYKQIAAFEGHVKFYLQSKALPSKLYRASTYLIPLASMKSVDEFLEASAVEYRQRVDTFVAAYEQRKQETMARLGSIASEADYASEAEVRDAFSFEYEYVTLTTPSTLKQISAAMFQREEQRLAERLKTVEEEVTAAFRADFTGVVSDMKAMLDGTKDGKAQRFHGWRIAKLQKYIENFKSEQNVCGDSGLVSIMDEAEKLLSGVDPKELKNNQKWREQMSASFAEISQKLETMTRVRGKRQIDADDDEEVA